MTPSSPSDAVQKMACDIYDREGESPSPMEPGRGGCSTARRPVAAVKQTLPKAVGLRQALHPRDDTAGSAACQVAGAGPGEAAQGGLPTGAAMRRAPPGAPACLGCCRTLFAEAAGFLGLWPDSVTVTGAPGRRRAGSAAVRCAPEIPVASMYYRFRLIRGTRNQPIDVATLRCHDDISWHKRYLGG